MLRKLLLCVGIIALSCSSFAQAFFKLESEDAVLMVILSNNGMYACRSSEGVAYLYDFAVKQMTVVEGSNYVIGVSDNGIFIGSESDIPSYIKDGECMHLSLPEGFAGGTARGINTDGSLIVGYVYPSGSGMGRVPCIWTLQSGSYVPVLLPTHEKDFTDRKPQGVDALHCSAKGDVIVGRMVDNTGRFCSLVVWTKNGTGNWELKDLGKDVIFKEGAVIPSIPDPEPPVAMEYFTAQDSITYNKALEDYAAGLIDENPEWYKQNYITHPDSVAKYNEATAEYNAILDIVAQKTEELYDCYTGKKMDVYGTVISGNGRYVGLSVAHVKDGVKVSPLCFDLQNGTWSLKEYVKNALVGGITDSGDLFFATPEKELIRNSFVIPAGTDDVIDVAEWVKQGTNGVVDLSSHFTFSYMNPQTGEQITDSLIVGTVTPSANGRVLLGSFYSPVAPEIITYFVNMDDPESIEGTDADTDAVIVYPNPATDAIYIKGNVDKVTVSDLSGRTVYESSCISGSIPVDMLPEGVYLLKVKAANKTTTRKIVVKK